MQYARRQLKLTGASPVLNYTSRGLGRVPSRALNRTSPREALCINQNADIVSVEARRQKLRYVQALR